MADDYYTEVLDNLPFATTVRLFEQHLPKWFAYGLAGWFRLRVRLGIPPKPRYASRWNSRFESQPREEMPARALSRWAPRLERLHDLGFSVCGWSKSETIGAKEEALALLLDRQGTTLAQLLWIRMIGGHGIEEQTPLSFTSYFADGSELMTMALPADQLMLTDAMVPEYVDARFLTNTVPVAKVYAKHCDQPSMKSALRFSSDEAVAKFEQQRICFFEHAKQAGFIRRLSLREVESVRGFSLPS